MQEYNSLILDRLSIFLNEAADSITAETVEELVGSYGFGKEEAFRVLLTGALGLYDNKELMDLYIKDMVHLLDAEKYRSNPYYKTVKFDDVCGCFDDNHAWKTEVNAYKPYEVFVYNDLVRKPDGRLIPQIGFFDEEYEYPCIFQNGRTWMLITPNEIETMRKPIEEAFGDVATYGLGLGYFAFMVSAKEEVQQVTIVEKDREVIELFTEKILPQFPNKEKIAIIEADAFVYARQQEIRHDFVFADIWHDPSDGIDLYLKFKELERSGSKYAYWIEDTIKCYL